MVGKSQFFRYRARCFASKTFKSAVASILIVWIPMFILALEKQTLELITFANLGKDLLIACLIVLLNYLQKRRETETPRTKLRRSEARWILAHYKSACDICKAQIHAGDVALWKPANETPSSIRCHTCGNDVAELKVQI